MTRSTLLPHPPLTGGPWWTMQRGDDPIIATAIHDGTKLRPEISALMRLAEADRLREEDPHTGQAIVDVPTHVIPHRSRFEVDLNRARGEAVYLSPEQSWGLEVWRETPGAELVARSLLLHDAFYAMIGQLLDELSAAHGRFVLFDVHSYNHRRDGPDAAPTRQEQAPDINIGTYSMPRGKWAFLLDPLMEAMRGFDFNGRRLDVRENVAFQGKGELTRFVHGRYPGSGCAIAIEFKKFFMDEWTGAPEPAELQAMRALIAHSAAIARGILHA